MLDAPPDCNGDLIVDQAIESQSVSNKSLIIDVTKTNCAKKTNNE